VAEPDRTRVTLNLEPGIDGGADEAELLARRLRAELAGLNLELLEALSPSELSVDTERPFSRSRAAFSLRFLLAGVGVTSLVAALRDWLGRETGRHKVRVSIDGDTIELVNSSPEQREQLIDAFIQRHTGA
jgi:hypothetical protein